jgi:hypothetical protein
MSLVEACTAMAKVVQEATVNAREFTEAMGKVSRMGIPWQDSYYSCNSSSTTDTVSFTDTTTGGTYSNHTITIGGDLHVDDYKPPEIKIDLGAFPQWEPEPEPEAEPDPLEWLDERIEEVCALIR